MDPPAPALYRAFPDLVRVPAGAGFELVLTPFERVPHLLSAERVRVLLACRGCVPLDRHATALATLGQGDRATLRAHLAELAEAGFLLTPGELVRRLGAAGRDAPAPPPIAHLGIATRDRPEALRTGLTAHLENARVHGRAVEVVVAEGEVSPATRADTRASLAEISVRLGFPIFHAGFPERAAYAAALAARSGVPRQIIEFALLNPERGDNDVGAGVNAILLHAVGDLALLTDDDTRPRMRRPPGYQRGVTVSSRGDPTESWFPHPGRGAIPDRDPPSQSFLAAHEELLGRSVASLVEAHRRDGLDLGTASATLFRRLRGGGGRVLYTQTGCAGDTGTGSMGFYLLLHGPSRERLQVSEEVYRHAFESRQAVRAAPRLTLSDSAFCMAMGLGVDGRDLLPPFFPLQRNSDGTFGLAVRACFSDAFVGFVPWALEHVPDSPRTARFEAFLVSIGRSWCADLVCALMAQCPAEAEAGDPRQRLAALGAFLTQIGRLPQADFEAHLRRMTMTARARDMEAMADLLRTHRGTPPWWARDLTRAMDSLRAALVRPDLAFPADLAPSLGMDEARAAMQRMVRRYGELLSVWPSIWEAARALRREGVRPGALVRPA